MSDLSLNYAGWEVNSGIDMKPVLINIMNYTEEKTDGLHDNNDLSAIYNLYSIHGATFSNQNEEHIANCSLEEFQKKYMCENSPMISYTNTPRGSRNGSRNNSDSEDNEESINRTMMLTQSMYKSENTRLAKINSELSPLNEIVTHSKYEKLTISDVEKSLTKYYDVGDNSSGELDLLTTWLIGVVSILKYSKQLKTIKLWISMLFSASISASIAFIVPLTAHGEFWNLVYICGSSALNVIIIIIILWSKFEYDARTLEIVVSQYQHVRNILDPCIIGENERNMVAIRGEMELQINNINSHFMYVIPIEVSNMYPLLAHTNIFDVIKKIELYRKNLVIKFRDIKNEIRFIIHKWSMNGIVDFVVSSEETKLTNKQMKEKKRFLFLLHAKEETKTELLEMRNTYSQLNELFLEEMKYANSHKFLYTLSTFVYKKPVPQITIPVLKDYLRLIQ